MGKIVLGAFAPSILARMNPMAEDGQKMNGRVEKSCGAAKIAIGFIHKKYQNMYLANF